MKASLFLVAVLGIAQATPASFFQAAAVATEEKQGEKVICRRETVVGSRVQKRKVCMTRSELTKLENGTRDGMADYLKQGTAGAPRGN